MAAVEETELLLADGNQNAAANRRRRGLCANGRIVSQRHELTVRADQTLETAGQNARVRGLEPLGRRRTFRRDGNRDPGAAACHEDCGPEECTDREA